MELPLSTLALVILGFSFSFYALLVESQNNVNIPNQPIPPSPGLLTPLLPSSERPPFSPPPPLPSGTPSERAPSPHSSPQPQPGMPSNQSPSPHFPPPSGTPSERAPSPHSPPQRRPGMPSNQPPSAQSPLRPLPGTPSKQQPGNHQSPHHLKKNDTMPSQSKNKHDHHQESQNRIQHGGKTPPPAAHKNNAGKKIGLLFAGIAGILQIGVVGFLVFKRQQLLKVKDRYESCS